ncbi:MAG: aminotransferase class V-fold PLP-dependent enzyme [Lysobacterales bacterium]|jgi:selenocysteine lyase/cysteine desulfurase|nr:MAG: aminotransferase class V-fold PLP-dependent enzyme [Xanthomonadales bacterium]
MQPWSFDFLRSQIVGIDSSFETPYGRRLMVYCDYTASGRCLGFVERYLQTLQRVYANTHTEDDVTGRSMSRLLHEAEALIKRAVNAGPQGRIVACGTGATGAIDKLQQILGVALAPATRRALDDELEGFLGPERHAEFRRWQEAHRPVVFVGPYEHHSNEVTWRQGRAIVVEVNLADDGGVDLGHLETLLRDPAFQGRLRIGSFSAASNVTGMRSPVREITKLLHAHGAHACFDYAASGPYVEIDMNPPRGPDGADVSLDAVFLSPHKFLGGPGSSGVLVFNERLYPRELPPSVAGGGTVDYVSPVDQDFIADVEEREKAGTPGVLQILKAGLALELKRQVGAARIEARETELVTRAIARWGAHERVEILGNPDPTRRIGIVSFNLRDPRGRYLHPKFVTVLLNDLFGIQSRAGCSCAGPYGHRLLGIDRPTSELYRDWVRKGYHGIKPGWCRVGFHYTMDEAEAGFVMDAVEFVADHGHRFLVLYAFDAATGTWSHREHRETHAAFSLDAALGAPGCEETALSPETRARLYASCLEEARAWSQRLGEPTTSATEADVERFGELRFFNTV